MRGSLSAATDALAGRGLEPGVPAWIEPGIACDIPFRGPAGEARAALEGFVAGVDLVVQSEANRRKRLLVADMDSTMISVECIDELADYAGLKTQVATITKQAMRGEIDFAEALKARVAILKGLPENSIDACYRERVRFTPGARELVATMRAHGAWTLLVSGGFMAFTDKVAAALGFDEAVANRLLIDDGALIGEVAAPIVDGARKASALGEARQRLGLMESETMAVGDGANDLAMIEAAGLGIAFRAKPLLAAAADASIVNGDLGVLLFAQGYARSDWSR